MYNPEFRFKETPMCNKCEDNKKYVRCKHCEGEYKICEEEDIRIRRYNDIAKIFYKEDDLYIKRYHEIAELLHDYTSLYYDENKDDSEILKELCRIVNKCLSCESKDE